MHVPQTEVILRHADTELARVKLPPGEYVIGRSPEVEIWADTPAISRRHARLTINYDNLLIEDLGSSNGTFVAERRIADATRIFPNQDIRLGPDVVLEVRRERAPGKPGESLAPTQAAIRRFLPEEILVEKRYAVGGEIARGGMGAILDARQNTTQRTVAMKVMLNSGDEADVLRFIEEARITAQLDHPNIVPIYELGVDEHDQLFYTMKLVRGITLRKVLELLDQGVEATAKKYPLPALLTIFQKVCDAVAFANSKGIIHRDLKPDNIMLGDFGSVLVMDWGLAKVLPKKEDAPAADPPHGMVMSTRSAVPDTSGAMGTMSGTIIGTAQYMAPEQARGEGEAIDERADVYALGAILFHMLYLRPAVAGENAWEIVDKVKQGALDWTPPKKAPPESLDAVCRKALALDRDARYPSVARLQADIAAYQNGFATSAEPKTARKQLALFIKRHWAVSISVAGALGLLAAISAAFTWKVVGERNRANAALAELSATAPTFFSQAKLLTDQENLDDALAKIDIALKLDPTNADFHAERGNILQSLERFTEAAGEYGEALKLNPREAHAAENVALSRALAASKQRNGGITVNQRLRWRDALEQQGRDEEAILAGRSLGAGAQKMLPAWQAKLDAWLGSQAPRLTVSGVGYRLSLANLSLVDLSPLRGMPLVELDVSGNPHLKDLRPLSDSPLQEFMAVSTPALLDLSPLRGKKLRRIDLKDTNITDLRPLAGMPLQFANFEGSAVTDLTPLHGTKLASITLSRTNVRDLGPLAGLPLERLVLKGAPITSLDPVGDAPITYLEIDTPFDLASLRAHRLRTLRVLGGMFTHPEDLAKMTDLEVLILPPEFNDPAPLRNLPHLRKIDFAENSNTPVELLKDAAEFFRQYDAPQVRTVREALAKCGLTDVPVRSVSVDPEGRLCVDLSRQPVGDLAPLHGLPINELNLTDTAVEDIGALRGMPLDTLYIPGTGVTDLSPLRGMPLTRVDLHLSAARDLSPLADCPGLQWIRLPANARNIESLRGLKKLRYLSPFWDNVTNLPAQTAAQFWKEYDGKHAVAN